MTTPGFLSRVLLVAVKSHPPVTTTSRSCAAAVPAIRNSSSNAMRFMGHRRNRGDGSRDPADNAVREVFCLGASHVIVAEAGTRPTRDARTSIAFAQRGYDVAINPAPNARYDNSDHLPVRRRRRRLLESKEIGRAHV